MRIGDGVDLRAFTVAMEERVRSVRVTTITVKVGRSPGEAKGERLGKALVEGVGGTAEKMTTLTSIIAQEREGKDEAGNANCEMLN
jgi:hypothetical protein